MFQFVATLIRIRTLGHELHERISAFKLSTTIPQIGGSCGSLSGDDVNIFARMEQIKASMMAGDQEAFATSDWLWTREAQIMRNPREDGPSWPSSEHS